MRRDDIIRRAYEGCALQVDPEPTDTAGRLSVLVSSALPPHVRDAAYYESARAEALHRLEAYSSAVSAVLEHLIDLALAGGLGVVWLLGDTGASLGVVNQVASSLAAAHLDAQPDLVLQVGADAVLEVRKGQDRVRLALELRDAAVRALSRSVADLAWSLAWAAGPPVPPDEETAATVWALLEDAERGGLGGVGPAKAAELAEIARRLGPGGS